MIQKCKNESSNRSTDEINIFLGKLTNKFAVCGLPESAINDFVSLYRMELTTGLCPEIRFSDDSIPPEDCFRTLAVAQSMLNKHSAAQPARILSALEIRAYLKQPYSDVEKTKSKIQKYTGWAIASLDELFASPEYLLLTDSSVDAFFAWLNEAYSGELPAKIYRKVALLGLEETKRRVWEITGLLGAELCNNLVSLESNRDGWLFYGYSTDPVGCIKYMLDKGLTKEKVMEILTNEPVLLWHYKDAFSKRYHDQALIDGIMDRYL